MTLVPFLPDRYRVSAQEQVTQFVKVSLPKETATEFSQNLDRILNGTKGGSTFRIAGLLTALWAAAGGMSMTMSALDRCYELPLTGGRAVLEQTLPGVRVGFLGVV